ncbi:MULTISPECIES: DHA2 family efflux MFS transporter permease subunit [unclassified Pseudomonas]|uniref:DHA2 family efflux MFS transporter permease subunit n=1 Tax=unclassified Pseudomonas TaxID=196821 RepID=UPI0035C15828
MNGQRLSGTSGSGLLLLAGVLLAALTEALAGTALALARNDMLGDTAATPDEFAWLDIGYLACKMFGFLLASWWLGRFSARAVVIGATLTMGTACALAAITYQLEWLVALRVMQGLAGGVLLVAGQALLFLACRHEQQPVLQALFAMGAVVAPASLAPAVQGWLIDLQSWVWIFFAVLPLGLAAAGVLLMAELPRIERPRARRFDALGVLLAAVALACLTYVLSQGSRWDWFEQPHLGWACVVGIAALLALLGQQLLARDGQGLLDFDLFRCSDFTFAFIVSFVAGAALFGSAFLIPAFALSALAFTPTETGLLLLPSGALFVAALLLAAYLFQARRVAPFATVPLGILSIMLAMWMLSGSTRESGADDMMAAVLLRGGGLGFLFLSITLIAFGGLDRDRLASGIGLFNTARQLGGLLGVAGLQTLIDHHQVLNVQVIGAHITPGTVALGERLATTAAMLRLEGLEASAAARVATSLLGRAVSEQGAVIAFDAAFNAVALLFVVAAPLLVCIKVVLAKRAR